MNAALSVLGAAALAVLAVGTVRELVPAQAGSERIGNPALGKRPGGVGHGTPLAATGTNQLAAFAQGCFWGVEERFRRVPGVVATAVGYSGGETPDPTYEQVSGHGTGHAESVLVEFDPAKVTYEKLLEVFWQTHDPTTADRQGPDRGSQYRSAIFTFGPEQQKAALASRDAEQGHLSARITTQIAPAGRFWIAEDYHQQWDEKHGTRSCPVPHRPKRS